MRTRKTLKQREAAHEALAGAAMLAIFLLAPAEYGGESLIVLRWLSLPGALFLFWCARGHWRESRGRDPITGERDSPYALGDAVNEPIPATATTPMSKAAKRQIVTALAKGLIAMIGCGVAVYPGLPLDPATRGEIYLIVILVATSAVWNILAAAADD
jgi:hypothetical protein